MSFNNTPRWLLLTIVFAGAANFVVFFIVAIAIGGDAVNGCVRNGHYFVASHGRYTEVSRAIFNYSRWHVYSVFITQTAAILAGIVYQAQKMTKPDAS
jgi:hypothetical protein